MKAEVGSSVDFFGKNEIDVLFYVTFTCHEKKLRGSTKEKIPKLFVTQPDFRSESDYNSYVRGIHFENRFSSTQTVKVSFDSQMMLMWTFVLISFFVLTNQKRSVSSIGQKQRLTDVI